MYLCASHILADCEGILVPLFTIIVTYLAPVLFSPRVFSMYAASSAEALGTIPGSLNAVRSNVDITNINNHAAINGTAGETLSNK